jgi:hypothetical protein
MALRTLESVKLRAVPVACDAVVGQSMGSNGAVRLRAMFLSRHLTQAMRLDPSGPVPCTENSGATRVARAGRLARFAGVSVHRGLAIIAGRAILSRWPQAMGKPGYRGFAGHLRPLHAGLLDVKSWPCLPGRRKA